MNRIDLSWPYAYTKHERKWKEGDRHLQLANKLARSIYTLPARGGHAHQPCALLHVWDNLDFQTCM